METHAYHKILDHMQSIIPQLSMDEQLKLLEEMATIIRKRNVGEPLQKDVPQRHNVMEFRGLGKEIWEGIDAQEYVRREREDW